MKEPSMSLIKRMGEVAPEKLASEVARLRQERDDLKKALMFKMSAQIATLKLAKDDIVLIHAFKGVGTSLVTETVEALCDRLRSVHGWEGTAFVQSGTMSVETLDKEDAEILFEKLKQKLGK